MAEIRWININIGCIETYVNKAEAEKTEEINFNMGCIETIALKLDAGADTD